MIRQRDKTKIIAELEMEIERKLKTIEIVERRRDECNLDLRDLKNAVRYRVKRIDALRKQVAKEFENEKKRTEHHRAMGINYYLKPKHGHEIFNSLHICKISMQNSSVYFKDCEHFSNLRELKKFLEKVKDYTIVQDNRDNVITHEELLNRIKKIDYNRYHFIQEDFD